MEMGPSKPTLYEVQLPNSRVGRETTEYLSFFCKVTAIPEVRVNTIFVPGHDHMGIVREQPTNVMFGKPFTMNVIADSEFKVYKDLREWFNASSTNANQGNNANRSHRMKYYGSFTEDMKLIKLEVGGDGEEYRRVLTVNFINAFPIQIGTVDLSSENTNAATEFQVQFAYESYNIEEMGSEGRGAGGLI